MFVRVMKKLFYSILISLTFTGSPAMATEEIAHTVIEKDGDIEIRHYDETVMAEVIVEGDRDEAINRAFRTLFNYIDGNNIAMTTPVSQEQSSVSKKIAMTTPVSQKQADGENTWSVAFYMPNDMSYEDTPKPKDDAVTIRRVPERKMAAIRFSGLRSNGNLEDHEQELRDYLQTNNIIHDDTPLYAFYDAPWVPWFLRRNEILLPLQ
jgi:effector-binding domain-containing protein